ncbi:MAG: uroporphyrinogen decarboxylase family protein, partial [Actinomycetota bacterium]
IKNPKPDIGRFLGIMKGNIIPDKPPIVEYLIDNAVMKPILEEMLGLKWVDTSDKTEYMGGQMDFSREKRGQINAMLDNLISFWYHMGYDFIRIEASLYLPAISMAIEDTAKVINKQSRAWQDEHIGVIKSWEDFENYPWPEIKEEDFYIHNYISSHLPDGMGFITCHAGGVYEHLSRLMSYEGLCFALIDDPQLFQAVTDKIGSILLQYYKYLLEIKQISLIFQGEDFGYNNQTLISPKDINKYFLPWHQKFAKLCHENDKLYFLHSCGKINLIMEDLINDVKIDGKHSFQDEVLPITEAKKIYGDRICLLGGVDIDKLTRLEPAELRKYVRKIIDNCAPGGKFAIGSGNSISSYIPVINYLTMLDEALK